MQKDKVPKEHTGKAPWVWHIAGQSTIPIFDINRAQYLVRVCRERVSPNPFYAHH